MSREYECVGSQVRRCEVIDEMTMTDAPWGVNGGDERECGGGGASSRRRAVF